MSLTVYSMDPFRVNEKKQVSETGATKASTTKISFWLSRRRILEAVLLSCVILVIWGLFSVPTILYILRPLQVSSINESLYHHELHFSTGPQNTPINSSNSSAGMRNGSFIICY